MFHKFLKTSPETIDVDEYVFVNELLELAILKATYNIRYVHRNPNPPLMYLQGIAE
jgi:hypothetical protein